MNSPLKDLKELLKFIVLYQSKKTIQLGRLFERLKNNLVDILMLKRGRFQKHVWHSSMIGLASVGVLSTSILGNNASLASNFTGGTTSDPRYIQTFDPFASGVSLNSFVNLKTSISSKPRSEIISYEVKGGETVSQIAEKFGIDTDTIKWENDLNDINSVKPGDSLKILPVSGVAVTVKSGDTLDSLAKKYNASSQAILDFPFNDIPDDQTLTSGQVLIIPDGSPPDVPAPARPKPQPQYLAQGQSGPSFSAPGGGTFIWPTHSIGISQYFAWYHPGVDLPNPAEPPVVASDGGVITYAGWDTTGYGNRIDIDHGNGYTTRYAHLSNIYVTIGQSVSRGETIGQMGNTGRSTGPHLHFEIHYKNVAINPLAILQ